MEIWFSFDLIVFDKEEISFSLDARAWFNEDIFSFYQSKCSEEEYYILIHHVIYNETFKEIARDKNASINSIKSTYRRLIKKLKGEHYEKNK